MVTMPTANHIGPDMVGIIGIITIAIGTEAREADPFRPRVSQGSSCLAMD
jgi:hypothetical protein